MTEIRSRFQKYFSFSRSTSIAPLVIFRIIFGAMMFMGILRFISKGWVKDMYIDPSFYFGYLGFEWVKPLPENWMYLPFICLLLSSLGILLGAFYRISTILFFLCFTYIEMLDKTNYLNHYYFISLIAFLLILVPANALFSVDVRLNITKARRQVPIWTIGIFKFQLACVYVFAGIAKLESDWLLQAQPLKIWLQAHRDMPVFGELLAQKWVAYLFSWFGCFYDLFIAFFLLSIRFRGIAYLVVIAFHLFTWYLLPIGIFPWVMIFSTLIFFSVNFHEKIVQKLTKITGTTVDFKSEVSSTEFATRNWARTLLILYIFVQLAVPFRYLYYPGNLFWTEEGFRFSWRVMLMHKEGNAQFFVKDKKTGGEIEINNCKHLTTNQIDQMSTQPDMILQYAAFLKDTYSDTLLTYGNQTIHLKNPEIHASVFVSLNGRPSQLFISKNRDLTQILYNFAPRNWLEPFKE